MTTDNKYLSTSLKCPIDGCSGGFIRFRLRSIKCRVTNTFLGVHDMVCDTCNYERLNVFDLKCEPSVDELADCITRDSEEMGEISISQVIQKYYVSNNLAIAAFKKLGAMY